MSRFAVSISWDDVPHLDDQAKQSIIDSYLPHERDARSRGIPSPGAGAIYPIAEADITCAPFEFPLWYRFCYGMDVGWNRTAAIWGAIDPETDVLYCFSEYYRGQTEPPIHAAAIQSRGKWIPGVIDPASRGRSQKDGQQLLQIYQQLGLSLITADNGVESGLYKVWTRMSTGRLKVFSTCQNFFEEFRIYRRDEKGKIIKEKDHLLDALRYLCASAIDIAAQRPADQWNGRTINGVAGKPKHEINYEPLGQMWSPQTGSAESVRNKSQSPWMPHKVG
jgi:hypothetical protein